MRIRLLYQAVLLLLWTAAALGVLACSDTPQPLATPDIEGTVQARLKEERALQATVEAREEAVTKAVVEPTAPIVPTQTPPAAFRETMIGDEPTATPTMVADVLLVESAALAATSEPAQKAEPTSSAPTMTPTSASPSTSTAAQQQNPIVSQPQTAAMPTPTRDPTLDSPATSTVALSQDGIARLRQDALDLVNERRRQLGLTPLALGNNVAAQWQAEESLIGLKLADVTAEGLPVETLYQTSGGRGYVRRGRQISGYWDQSSISQCESAQVTCERVVPDEGVTEYISDLLEEDIVSGRGLLAPWWSSFHLGIAYTDLTLVIVQYLEHQGLDYVREPSIGGGFLSLEVTPRSEQDISSIQVYAQRQQSEGLNQELQVLAVFEPPKAGQALQLPDDLSVVADYWQDNGQSIEIVVAVEGRLPGPGIYELVIWAGQGIPASQYYIRIEDPKDLELDLSVLTFDQPERPSLERLRLFALDLINADREAHGVPPVRLGSIDSAQIHAEDALAAEYLVGHWTAGGLKPYMLYLQAGGTGVVSENAAGGGFPRSECRAALVVCGPVDAEADIASHQWSMMYDDAHADWGHRDTIINPNYDTVNIGIGLDDHRLTFYQHFEYNGVAYVEEPVLAGHTLRTRVRSLDGHSIDSISVYYDPPPTPKSPSEIKLLHSYCTGGGFTDNCDDVAPVANVLKPPPIGAYYTDLESTHVVARTWNGLSDGSIEIEADLGSLVGPAGVYTIVVWSASDSRALSQYSIFR